MEKEKGERREGTGQFIPPSLTSPDLVCLGTLNRVIQHYPLFFFYQSPYAMPTHHQEISTMESKEDDPRDFTLPYSQTTNPGPSSPASSHSSHHEADQSNESSESELSNSLLSRPLQMHSYTARVALSALIDHQIIVVEYGSQTQYRYGYEEVLIVSYPLCYMLFVSIFNISLTKDSSLWSGQCQMISYNVLRKY